MPPLRVHYLPTPDFSALICGTPHSDIEDLRTTQDGSQVDCRRCLRYIEPYRANPATLAAYAAGCVSGYSAGYDAGFGDADVYDEDEEDDDDWG